MAALHQEGLIPPPGLPEHWVVDCKCVGSGEKALVYLGRYLYRGVIQEKDIIRCENDQVTYRWRDSKTKKMALRCVSGATFLWLVLQHVLPKGFRRARNYGFLHPNSKRLIALLRLLVFRPPVSLPPQRRVRNCCAPAAALRWSSSGDESCRPQLSRRVLAMRTV